MRRPAKSPLRANRGGGEESGSFRAHSPLKSDQAFLQAVTCQGFLVPGWAIRSLLPSATGW